MTEIFGRITGKTSDGSVSVTQTFTYNNRNLLETATDTVGNAATSVTRHYDSFGNPYSESVTANNITKTVSRRMTDAKTYQFTYPDGKTLRKTATGNDLDSIEYNNSEIASYSRADGVLTAITKGQNLIETFSYNSWNMLDNHTISNANADVYDMSYNYSRGWHLIEKADGIKNTLDKYAYDSYYRLKEVKYDFANNAAARTDSFFQDGVHNIEQSTENGVTYAWGVDKLNRLRDKKVGGNTAVTYKYDKRNNMIGEDFDGSEPTDISYIYDDLNRLIEVKDGSNQTIATYTYDAFNRRITKTVGSTTERYTYDDWDIVEISTNSNDYANIIDSGTDRHIAIEVTSNNISTLYYFLTDERGNVTALTDANGNVLERYRYRVYGDFEILDSQFIPKDCSNQTCYATNLHNFLWGGSLYEPETGLYWMRNRYYHIDMHRFINQDPIGIWGDANNLGNGFAYVAGMVIEASDPSGLDTEFIYWLPITSLEHLEGSFGHISIRIDDASYSWELTEMNITNFEDYKNANVDYRLGFAVVLNISKEKENILRANLEKLPQHIWRVQGGYGLITNNCGQIALREISKATGYQFNDIILPKAVMREVFDSPLNRGEKWYTKQSSYPVAPTKKDEQKATAPQTGTQASADPEESATTDFLRVVNWIHMVQNSDGSRTYTLANGDKVTVGPDGKIINCQGDCTQTPEGATFKEKYPSDPYEDTSEAIQKVLMNNILAKMLKRGESEQSPVFIDNSTGPNGAIMIYRNPYYINKDPLKNILILGYDGSKPIFVRNPLALPASRTWSNTYEKWQQSGFVQPEVDPWE